MLKNLISSIKIDNLQIVKNMHAKTRLKKKNNITHKFGSFSMKNLILSFLEFNSLPQIHHHLHLLT